MTDFEHRAHDPAPAEPAPELLVGGSAAYACMWRLVRQARTAVELETYIYEAGTVGDRFLAELTSAARRGVQVRVLVDAYGSDTLRPDYFAPLIAAGGELRWFNPKRLLRLNFRNHRKLSRADGEAVVGERSDVPVSRWASERLFTRFLRAGLRIHRYRPQIVHAKAMVLDDVVYVGSSNLDVRSLLINYELLLRLPSAAIVSCVPAAGAP